MRARQDSLLHEIQPCLSRTKHIELKYFFVQDLVEEEKIKLEYVPIEEIMTDIFPKALDKLKFKAFRDQMLTK